MATLWIGLTPSCELRPRLSICTHAQSSHTPRTEQLALKHILSTWFIAPRYGRPDPLSIVNEKNTEISYFVIDSISPLVGDCVLENNDSQSMISKTAMTLKHGPYRIEDNN